MGTWKGARKAPVAVGPLALMRPEPVAAPPTASPGVNERSVEVPWALERLDGARRSAANGPARILDVGCSTSSYLEGLARQPGLAVYGLEPQEALPVPRALVVRGSVVVPPFPYRAFDLILCISTVEHIGLPVFEQHEFARGDVLAMRHMRRLLKPGGRLLLTVPFGRGQRNSWFRVYDAPSLVLLTAGFRGLSESYFRLVPEGEGRYEACDQRDLRDAAYDFAHMRAEGVVCLELGPSRRPPIPGPAPGQPPGAALP